MRKKVIHLMLGLFFVAAGLSACGGGGENDNQSGIDGNDISGTITVFGAGSSTISNGLTTGGLTASYLTVSGSTYLATAGGNVGIGTTTPSAALGIQGDIFLAGRLVSTSSTATSTFGGQLVSGFAPTWAHSFGSWSVGAAGANPLGASFFPHCLRYSTSLFTRFRDSIARMISYVPLSDRASP